MAGVVGQSKLRIAVVGDVGAGKSTLITSFLREVYEEVVPHVLPEVSIPAEVTIDKVETFISDTSEKLEYRELLTTDIQRASVICLVYNAVDGTRESLARISQYWIPMIRSLRQNNAPPIVLVGNKIDLRSEVVAQSENTLDDVIIPLMSEFKEIETVIECSAKDLVNVAEVFYFASKAVMHPTAPLFDVAEQTMKPAATAALARIFSLCDKDKNGIMNDDELNEFQKKVFGVPLQQQELEGVKEVVREGVKHGLSQNGLTKEGFVYLHSLFIQRGRMETIWTVFRKFGYDDNLELREEFLLPPMDIPVGSATELSPKGYQFFTDLFQTFDKDKDGALKEKELVNLFSTAPGNPWLDCGFPDCTTTNDNGAITLQGFLAMWSMTTLLDYQTTLAYLAYLGYGEDRPSAIKVIRNKKSDRMRGKTGRNVFRALVFGATGSGKTKILKRFVEKRFDAAYRATTGSYAVVNSVEMSGSEKYLVLQEVGTDDSNEILQNKAVLGACDVLCFVYDCSDPNSFSYILNLRNQFPLDKYPTVFIGTKSDASVPKQLSSVQPEEYCQSLKLAPPLQISIKNNDATDLYNIIVGVAMNPHVAIPEELSRSQRSMVRTIALTGITAASLAVGGIVLYRFLRRSHVASTTAPSSQ